MPGRERVQPAVTIAAGVLAAACLGKVAAVSVVVGQAFRLSPLALGAAISLITFVTAAVATPAGLWLRGKDARRWLAAGLAVMAVAGGAVALVPPSTVALDQARAAGRFTPVHDAWWAAARTAHGDAAGTRALVEVLLLHRRMAYEHVVAGIAAALRAGAMTADVVAMEARKAADASPPDAAAQPDEIPGPSPVASLTERRLAALPADSRPLPSVAAYDQLLRRPRPPATRPASQGDQL